MAHWAELDENNIVLRVTVGDNDDPNGDEGYQWLIDNLGGRWVQTSYNNNFRVRFAVVGGSYDEQRDAFIPPKPFPSWILDEASVAWVASVPYPTDGDYDWDEENQSWAQIELATPNS